MAVRPALYHADLCAGSGMLGLAVKLALGGRVRTVVYVEREAYAAAALVARMADAALDNAPVWDDVKSLCDPKFLGYVRRFRPLVVTAGYPCQPFSVAGKRRGVHDDRHLWPWIDAFTGEAKPECVFLENVPGHLRMGFGSVRRDLQRRGYRVAAGLFSAEEVGASHRRERLFIPGLADPERQRRESRGTDAVWEGAGECRVVHGGEQLADAPVGGRGAVRQSPERRGQPDGRDCPLAHAEDADRRTRVEGFQDGARFGRDGFADHGPVVGDAARGQGHGGAGGALEQAPSQGRRVHAAAGDAGRAVADAASRRGRPCGTAEDHDVEHGGPGRDRDAVADAYGGDGDALGARRHPTQADRVPLADASGTGLEGAERTGSLGEWLGAEAPGPVAEFRAPLFAPGPGALDEWREILAHDPSLEPAIRRVVDGLAPGMVGDRLRLTGNGVVPLAAGYAFVSLCAALLDG